MGQHVSLEQVGSPDTRKVGTHSQALYHRPPHRAHEENWGKSKGPETDPLYGMSIDEVPTQKDKIVRLD